MFKDKLMPPKVIAEIKMRMEKDFKSDLKTKNPRILIVMSLDYEIP
jgi:hypothetical protein